MQLRHLHGTLVFGLLLGCTTLAGCDVRALTEKDVIGTYEVEADWGKSTLVLHADHTFDQAVVRNNHTQASMKGKWEFTPFAGKSSSYAMIGFKPFLAVSHDQMGDPSGGAALSVSRGLFRGVIIGLDPDWGMSYQKT